MDIQYIQSLIKQQESETLELKKSTSLLKPAFETICGFLNGKGGVVLIGVADNGDILGQDVTDKTKQEIAREIDKIEPHANIQIAYIPCHNGKKVILLEAPKGLHSPYTYDGRAFKRIQSTTTQMSQQQYKQLLTQGGQFNYRWDEMPAVAFDLSLLNEEEIQQTLKQGIQADRIPSEALNDNIQDVLKRLKLMNDDTLTNAAVILFAKNELLRDYPQCHLKMARFRGNDKTGDFIDNQSVDGNAFFLLAEATMFMKRHLPIASTYQQDKFERIDEPTLPALAVREALINALCHRDYSTRSSYISLAIYDDRLEIWSYGLLPHELTVEDLKKSHTSHPRNQLIADIFFKRKLVEKWGTGTTKMIHLCEERQLPPPEFKEYSGGVSVIFKFKEPIRTTTEPPPLYENLTPRQTQIISILIKQGSLTSYEIISELKEPIPERTLRFELGKLKELNIVDKQGKTKATRWFMINNKKS